MYENEKFINNPENLTPELLERLIELANKDLVSLGRALWSSITSWPRRTV